MNKKILYLLGAISLLALSGCKTGTIVDDDLNIGYFVDSPVEGVTYETASGKTGVTDKNGAYKYKYNEEVTFKIGNLILGTTDTKDIITPEDLTHNNSEKTDLMLQMLQSMDEDNNLSNGIKISKYLKKSLAKMSETNFYNKINNEDDLLSLNVDLANKIDSNFNGKIDINKTEAKLHFKNTKNVIKNSNGSVTKFIKDIYLEKKESNGNTELNDSGNTELNDSGNTELNNDVIEVEDNNNIKNDIDKKGVLSKTEKKQSVQFYNVEKITADLYSLWNEQFDIDIMNNIYSRTSKVTLSSIQKFMKNYDISLIDPYDTSSINSHYGYNEFEFSLLRGQYNSNEATKAYDFFSSTITSKDLAILSSCKIEAGNMTLFDNFMKNTEENSGNKDLINLYKKARENSFVNYTIFRNYLMKEGKGDLCPNIKIKMNDINPDI